jgi:hypothetical protein
MRSRRQRHGRHVKTVHPETGRHPGQPRYPHPARLAARLKGGRKDHSPPVASAPLTKHTRKAPPRGGAFVSRRRWTIHTSVNRAAGSARHAASSTSAAFGWRPCK